MKYHKQTSKCIYFKVGSISFYRIFFFNQFWTIIVVKSIYLVHSYTFISMSFESVKIYQTLVDMAKLKFFFGSAISRVYFVVENFLQIYTQWKYSCSVSKSKKKIKKRWFVAIEPLRQFYVIKIKTKWARQNLVVSAAIKHFGLLSVTVALAKNKICCVQIYFYFGANHRGR